MLSQRIKQFVAAEQKALRAVTYRLSAEGHGTTPATGTGVIESTAVTHSMSNCRRGSLAVMLIDMQTNGTNDSGATVTGNKFFDGKGHIEHMAEVLKVAVDLDLLIYEIVIDKQAAKSGGRGNVKTIPTLKLAMAGASATRIRFLPKPFFNSFHDTPLAGWLKEDQVKTIIAMGYDANTCVMNTIFGTGETMETTSGRKGTKAEILEWRKETPNENEYRDDMVPDIEEKKLRPYMRGLLDRGYTVITSRAIVASGTSVLDNKYGPIGGT